MDTETIQQTVSAYAEELAKWYIDSGWHLEGDAPDVTSPNFDADTPCQTLVMDSGIPAVNIDEDVLYSEILEAYETNQPLVNYAGPLDVSYSTLAGPGKHLSASEQGSRGALHRPGDS